MFPILLQPGYVVSSSSQFHNQLQNSPVVHISKYPDYIAHCCWPSLAVLLQKVLLHNNYIFAVLWVFSNYFIIFMFFVIVAAVYYSHFIIVKLAWLHLYLLSLVNYSSWVSLKGTRQCSVCWCASRNSNFSSAALKRNEIKWKCSDFKCVWKPT